MCSNFQVFWKLSCKEDWTFSGSHPHPTAFAHYRQLINCLLAWNRKSNKQCPNLLPAGLCLPVRAGIRNSGPSMHSNPKLKCVAAWMTLSPLKGFEWDWVEGRAEGLRPRSWKVRPVRGPVGVNAHNQIPRPEEELPRSPQKHTVVKTTSPTPKPSPQSSSSKAHC